MPDLHISPVQIKTKMISSPGNERIGRGFLLNYTKIDKVIDKKARHF
jgi:hypothetical protein